MIPVKIGQPPDWHEVYDKRWNDEWRKEELDLLLEISEQAQLRNERHKALITRAVNQKIKRKSFPEGLLIL